MERLTNSKLRAFAIVEAQLTKGLEKPSDYLIPLLQDVVSRYENKPLDIDVISKKIKKEFSLVMPIYMIQSLLPSLVKVGALEYDELHQCYVCKRSIDREIQTNLTDEHFELIGDKLKEHALRYDLKKPLLSKDWQDALLNFFANNGHGSQDILTGPQKAGGSHEREAYVIAKFILKNKTYNNDIYKIIKRIYAAFSITETVISIQDTGHLDDWSGLTIIYDAPVLLRVAGTSGEFFKQATLELNELLQNNGCKTGYFDHSLYEASSSLDAIVHRYKNGETIHKETAKAIEDGEISIGQINLLRGGLLIELSKYGIEEIVLPERMTDVAGQIDPLDLEAFLKTSILYRSAGAARADADSVEKLLFLRKGNNSKIIPKSKFIFVTHNNKLAKFSFDYCELNCQYKRPETPPVVTLSTLTKIAWLASDNKEETVDITKDLVCKCYQASLPDETWFNKFWKTIENTNPELLDDSIRSNLYLIDVRNFAEDASMGRGDLLDLLNFGDVIKKAKEVYREREKEHGRELAVLDNKNKELLDNHRREMIAVKEEKAKEVLRERKIKMALIDNLASNAAQRARLYSRALTGVVALVFISLFISLSTSSPPWLLEGFLEPLKYILIFLGAMQIGGLFFPCISFVFLGPLIERVIQKALLKSYMALID